METGKNTDQWKFLLRKLKFNAYFKIKLKHYQNKMNRKDNFGIQVGYFKRWNYLFVDRE